MITHWKRLGARIWFLLVKITRRPIIVKKSTFKAKIGPNWQFFQKSKSAPFNSELDELKSKVWEGLEIFEILGFLNGSMSSPPTITKASHHPHNILAPLHKYPNNFPKFYHVTPPEHLNCITSSDILICTNYLFVVNYSIPPRYNIYIIFLHY